MCVAGMWWKPRLAVQIAELHVSLEISWKVVPGPSTPPIFIQSSSHAEARVQTRTVFGTGIGPTRKSITWDAARKPDM